MNRPGEDHERRPGPGEPDESGTGGPPGSWATLGLEAAFSVVAAAVRGVSLAAGGAPRGSSTEPARPEHECDHCQLCEALTDLGRRDPTSIETLAQGLEALASAMRSGPTGHPDAGPQGAPEVPLEQVVGPVPTEWIVVRP